jgi:SAM-dependent methyltransferase
MTNADTPDSSPWARPRIFALSALILFVEMLLVRWVGTELRVFAYLQNGVLVAAFLGLGLGCRNARSPARLLPAVLALAAIALVIRDPYDWGLAEGITQGLMAFQDAVVWSKAQGAPLPPYLRTALMTYAVLTSFLVLAAIAYVFRPLGQWLGAWMDADPRPIAAYSANILGSLAGIALFVAATVVGTSPFTWLLATGVGLALCATAARDGRIARAAAAALALAVPFLARHEPAPTAWSPYQKLTRTPFVAGADDKGGDVTCGQIINVNNVGYQLVLDLDFERLSALHPRLYPPADLRISHYRLPHELVGKRDDVLVVGAGAGNDVAAALRAGARSVHAVEIDPTIVALGRQLHPNQPYASPRVTVAIDDARAFFRAPTGPYDLIWFGLLDSHTTPSAYSNVRLDHFVYTRESLADMKALLKPTGVVVLFFEAQTSWIGERLARLMALTFGQEPLVFQVETPSFCLGWGGLLLVNGSPEAMTPLYARLESDPQLRARQIALGPLPKDVPITTDDWPYLYLRSPELPPYYVLVALASLVLAFLLRGQLFRPGESLDPTMLLLGMGFMLLEVVGVSRAALLFGTTWTVNAYVVGAIFAMILLANLVASRRDVASSAWPAVGLVASILALALVPASAFASLPLAVRVIVGGGFLALPVFFSGLVFVAAWARTERKDLSLGSNLLGSLLGGIASMLSLEIGFRALMFLTLAVYLGALLLVRRRTPRRVLPS